MTLRNHRTGMSYRSPGSLTALERPEAPPQKRKKLFYTLRREANYRFPASKLDSRVRRARAGCGAPWASKTSTIPRKMGSASQIPYYALADLHGAVRAEIPKCEDFFEKIRFLLLESAKVSRNRSQMLHGGLWGCLWRARAPLSALWASKTAEIHRNHEADSQIS